MMKSKEAVLFIIVFSQFCCTSMWFASNAVLSDLIGQFSLDDYSIGYLSNAVQVGFIAGTLTMSILSIADRYSPSKVFMISSIIGALLNLSIIFDFNTLISLLGFRFGVGFCLAGIYPVGMKIASDYFENGLGKSLSYLVAALVLGTAFPHLLKYISGYYSIDWKNVVYTTSAISAFGGVLILTLIKDGPYRKPAQGVDFSKFITIFKDEKYRSFTIGYVGHMWELYAFWVFVPVILSTSESSINIPLWSFIIIACGSLACVVGGLLSEHYGNKKIATISLMLSGLCCLVFPFVNGQGQFVFIGLLIIWGVFVIADSPLFSALVAQSAPQEYRGTALTIATFLGFLVTIISIQILAYLTTHFDTPFVYWILLIGPILGVSIISKVTRIIPSRKI